MVYLLDWYCKVAQLHPLIDNWFKTMHSKEINQNLLCDPMYQQFLWNITCKDDTWWTPDGNALKMFVVCDLNDDVDRNHQKGHALWGLYHQWRLLRPQLICKCEYGRGGRLPRVSYCLQLYVVTLDLVSCDNKRHANRVMVKGGASLGGLLLPRAFC